MLYSEELYSDLKSNMLRQKSKNMKNAANSANSANSDLPDAVMK